MLILVLGGDGFCGWPTAVHLSDKGHAVTIVDNLSRRDIDTELGCDSLTPIAHPEVRIAAWKELTGKTIDFVNLDVAKEYDRLESLIKDKRPDSIVHFAEQRAAPYSQKGTKQKRYTVDNNVCGTHNLLTAVVEADCCAHIVHLGTMGVYGYGTSGGEIPEGYIDVVLPGGRDSRILHPAYPGSVYHTTKCLDALLFQFYAKNDGVRVTDLHQGIVWGTNTDLTSMDPRLTNRFDYDGDYGTVLNRFLMQAALNVPMTVYGTGGQTRAFIHISDRKCIEIAINNPPAEGAQPEIFNQVAETRRVRDIAELISKNTGVEARFLANPRQEAAENELDVSNRKFRALGFEPTKLNDALFEEVQDVGRDAHPDVNSPPRSGTRSAAGGRRGQGGAGVVDPAAPAAGKPLRAWFEYPPTVILRGAGRLPTHRRRPSSATGESDAVAAARGRAGIKGDSTNMA